MPEPTDVREGCLCRKCWQRTARVEQQGLNGVKVSCSTCKKTYEMDFSVSADRKKQHYEKRAPTEG